MWTAWGKVETMKKGKEDETRLGLDDSEIPLSLCFWARRVYEAKQSIDKELLLLCCGVRYLLLVILLGSHVFSFGLFKLSTS